MDKECDTLLWIRSLTESCELCIHRLRKCIFSNICATSKIGTLVLHANRHPPRVYCHPPLMASCFPACTPCMIRCRRCPTRNGIGTFWTLHRKWRSHVHALHRGAPDYYSSRGSTFPVSDNAYVSAFQIEFHFLFSGESALSPQSLPQMAEVIHAKLGFCV